MNSYVAVWCEHQRELVATVELRKLGAHDVYTPRHFVAEGKPRLLMPRYIFAMTDMSNEEINQICRARGVHEIVRGAGGRTYPIRADVILNMKNDEDEQFDAVRFRRKVIERTDLRSGDPVEVTQKGIWWGHKGTVMEVYRGGEALVLLGNITKTFVGTDLKKLEGKK